MSDAMEGKSVAAGPDAAETLALVPQLSAYFRRAHGEMPDSMRKSFAAHSLGARHGAVLTQLAAGESLTVGGVAERLGVSLSGASDLIGALDRAGWVERTTDPDNRRRTLVSLRPDRSEVVREFIAIRAEPVLRALDRLHPAERTGFVAGLRAWVDEIDR